MESKKKKMGSYFIVGLMDYRWKKVQDILFTKNPQIQISTETTTDAPLWNISYANVFFMFLADLANKL